jgi:hypothetical protein
LAYIAACMKYAEIDLGTIVYIIFLVLYGIYSMYKKSMKNAEKKYRNTTDPFPASLPKNQPKQRNEPKAAPKSEPKDIWKELMGEEATMDFPQEKKISEEVKQKPVEVKTQELYAKKKEQVIKPKTESVKRTFNRIPARPTISENSSFLSGDFSFDNNEGKAAITTVSRAEKETDSYRKKNTTIDFNPREAFKYMLLLERKYF